MMPAKAPHAIDTGQADMDITRRIRTLIQDLIEGFRAGVDVLLWGWPEEWWHAYPRTNPVPRKNDDAQH
jgi:hypothetical protein